MNKNILFRYNDITISDVDHVVRMNPEVYSSRSHFIRVALIRELKRNLKGEKK